MVSNEQTCYWQAHTIYNNRNKFFFITILNVQILSWQICKQDSYTVYITPLFLQPQPEQYCILILKHQYIWIVFGSWIFINESNEIYWTPTTDLYMQKKKEMAK